MYTVLPPRELRVMNCGADHGAGPAWFLITYGWARRTESPGFSGACARHARRRADNWQSSFCPALSGHYIEPRSRIGAQQHLTKTP